MSPAGLGGTGYADGKRPGPGPRAVRPRSSSGRRVGGGPGGVSGPGPGGTAGKHRDGAGWECGKTGRGEPAGGEGGAERERGGTGPGERGKPTGDARDRGRGCGRSRTGDAAAAAGARGKPGGECGGTGLEVGGSRAGGRGGNGRRRSSWNPRAQGLCPSVVLGVPVPIPGLGVPGSGCPSGDRGSRPRHVLAGDPSRFPPPAVRLQIPHCLFFPVPTMGWQERGGSSGDRARAMLCRAVPCCARLRLPTCQQPGHATCTGQVPKARGKWDGRNGKRDVVALRDKARGQPCAPVSPLPSGLGPHLVSVGSRQARCCS